MCDNTTVTNEYKSPKMFVLNNWLKLKVSDVPRHLKPKEGFSLIFLNGISLCLFLVSGFLLLPLKMRGKEAGTNLTRHPHSLKRRL